MVLKPKRPVPSDIEIAQEADLRPILEIADKIGLTEDDLDLYGKFKAKVHLDVLDRLVIAHKENTSMSLRSLQRH